VAVLIDSSVLIEAERKGDHFAVSVDPEPGAISAITLSELLHGAERAKDDGVRVRREAFVTRLLASLEAVPITDAVARVHARIWAALERAGTPISPHDLWIAATALTHGMAVATANVRDFERVPGLVVIPV
jgi:predicted nucleic acid-binding protein